MTYENRPTPTQSVEAGKTNRNGPFGWSLVVVVVLIVAFVAWYMNRLRPTTPRPAQNAATAAQTQATLAAGQAGNAGAQATAAQNSAQAAQAGAITAQSNAASSQVRALRPQVQANPHCPIRRRLRAASRVSKPGGQSGPQQTRPAHDRPSAMPPAAYFVIAALPQETTCFSPPR